MYRWFIALFALHFALSVGVLASGHAGERDMAVPHSALFESAQTPGQPHPHGAGLNALTLDHALSDTQPDLPDQLQPPPHPAVLTQVAIPVAAPAWLPHATPVLDGLRRPPRT